VRDFLALVDAAHVGAAGSAVGYAILILTAQNARVRGDYHDEFSIEPIIYERLGTTMTTTVCFCAPGIWDCHANPRRHPLHAAFCKHD
jgi:hypothetical protein